MPIPTIGHSYVPLIANRDPFVMVEGPRGTAKSRSILSYPPGPGNAHEPDADDLDDTGGAGIPIVRHERAGWSGAAGADGVCLT